MSITNSQEYVLTTNDIIVSKTDLKGIITFVNDDLVRITGFSRDELIGKAHNIFRHPDMPKEAFNDLWQTITRQCTWSGLVKNKTKNGGFYWVRANITPIYEDNRVVGYMSVRRKPDPANVVKVEKIYAEIKAGRFKGKLNCGDVVESDIFHTALRKFENIQIKNKLAGLVFVSLLCVLIPEIIGHFNLKTLNSQHQADIEKFEQYTTRINQAHSAQIDALLKGNLDTHQQLQQSTATLETELKTFIAEEKTIANDKLANKQMKKLVVLALIIFVLIALYKFIINRIVQSLEETTRVLAHISEGNYLVRINYRSSNEIGMMMEYIRSMSVRLGFDIAEGKKNATESLRLKIGLDAVSTGVIIADQERKIVYINESAMNLLSEAEADIRKDLPNFRVTSLMGTSIDTFHKNPAHQLKLLANLTSIVEANALIGGHHMIVKASPIIDEFGYRLGSVAEWSDETVRINLQNEIAEILAELQNGRFSRRIALSGKGGFLDELSSQINSVLGICDGIFSDIKRVFSAIALSDLTQTITHHYDGDFDMLKQDTNTAVAQLNEIVNQIKSTNLIINQGIGNIVEESHSLSTRTDDQVANLASTASAIHQLDTSGQCNSDDAKQANVAVNNVFEVVEKGVNIIGKVVHTMESINESSNKISDIIAVIDSIAFQTNILALNAAVEAARAGDQGKGFAVVATEVRSLAQRSAGAAGEIKTLIYDSEEKIEEGSMLVVEAGKIMSQISNSISNATIMMDRIVVSSTEQSLSIGQINSSIHITESISQENAQSVVGVIKSAGQLKEQIKQLSLMIQRFKVTN